MGGDDFIASAVLLIAPLAAPVSASMSIYFTPRILPLLLSTGQRQSDMNRAG
jgi:hypothetical protein